MANVFVLGEDTEEGAGTYLRGVYTSLEKAIKQVGELRKINEASLMYEIEETEIDGKQISFWQAWLSEDNQWVLYSRWEEGKVKERRKWKIQ